MPFIEEASPFLISTSTHELRYNQQAKKLGLVPIRSGPTAVPDREISQSRVAGSVSTLVQTVHHDMSVYYTDRQTAVVDATMMRHIIYAVARRMIIWQANDQSGLVGTHIPRFDDTDDAAASADPLGWLVEKLEPASGLVWQCFLPFLCNNGGGEDGFDAEGSDREKFYEDMLRVFIKLHIQSMYQAFLSANITTSLDTPRTHSMWVQMCVRLDQLDTYDRGVDFSHRRTRRHKAIVKATIGGIESLGLIDHFVYAVDPAIIWAALIKAVETDRLPANDEEVVMLTDLFLAVGVFNVGRRPDEAEAMMGFFTRSVAHPEVKDVIRNRARTLPAWTVAEPFRRRLGMLSQ